MLASSRSPAAPVTLCRRFTREEKERVAAAIWLAFAKAYKHQWVSRLGAPPEGGYASLVALQNAAGGAAGANTRCLTFHGGFAHKSSSGRVQWDVGPEGDAVFRVLRPNDVTVIQISLLWMSGQGWMLVPDASLVLTASYERRHVGELRTMLDVLVRVPELGLTHRTLDICQRIAAAGVRNEVSPAPHEGS